MIVLFLIPSVGLIILSIVFLFRNERVYKKRMIILNRVSALSQEDIKQGRDWRWRYLQMNTISYNEMVYKLWKSLDSFYEDAAFLR